MTVGRVIYLILFHNISEREREREIKTKGWGTSLSVMSPSSKYSPFEILKSSFHFNNTFLQSFHNMFQQEELKFY